jgi:hypothetical protein
VAALLTTATLVGAAPLRQAGVADARARHEAARADHRDATDALHAALEAQRSVSALAVQLEEQLRQLDRASLDKVLAFESRISEARELALEAYVRGGTQAELANYLDAKEATEVVVRQHLMIGRVDVAEEAAFSLQRERVLVDSQAAQVAAQIAVLSAELRAADEAVAAAQARERQAYTELLAAGASAEEAEAAAAEAARVAEAAAAEQAEAQATLAAEAEEANGEEPAVSTSPAEASVAAPFVPPGPVSSDQAEAWAKLRQCESGGNYAAIGGGGMYRGAYQFSIPTWESVGGVGDPAAASPQEQDHRARLLYERSGRGQWPICGQYLR